MPELDQEAFRLLLAAVIAGFAVSVFLIIAIVAWLKGKRKEVAREVNELAIDVTSLELDEVVASQQLMLYGTPMRLVVMVLAPSGHAVDFPPEEELPESIERLIPGLPGLLDSHQPEFRQWPAQLSIEGFKRIFFQNIPLPGDHGKGTPWCGVVGPFESKAGRLLAGLILLADEPNGYGKVEFDHEGQWHQAIQVKG